MKDIEDQNRKKHGDSGPFFVCATTTLQKGSTDNGFVSSCIKCRISVHIPEIEMTTWRNSGAVVVCPRCSGGSVGQMLKTF